MLKLLVFDAHIGVNLIPIITLRLALANIFVLIGFAFSVGALVAQHRIFKGETLEAFHGEISPKAGRLVVGGPYRYTCDPMLFGTCMYYYGLAISFNSVVAFAGAALFMALMLILVKALNAAIEAPGPEVSSSSEEQSTIADQARDFLIPT